MSDSAVSTAPKPRRLHWLQFSLRGFVVLMMLAAVVMAWWSYWHHRIRKQRIALMEIAALQSQLTKTPHYRIDEPITLGTNRTPWWLRADGEKTIPVTTGVSFDVRSRGVHKHRSHLRDRDLQMLGTFPYMYEVLVPRSIVGDDGLSWIKPLRRIRRLDLSYSHVDDADLAALSGLPDLEELNLDGVRISGEGLSHLADCPKLRWLSLADVPLTAEGAGKLNRLQSLTQLNIDSRTLDRLRLDGLGELQDLTIALSAEQVSLEVDRLPRLQRLTVSYYAAATPRQLRLTNLPQLTSLYVALPRGASFQPDQLDLIVRNLPEVYSVILHASQLPKDILPQIGRLPRVGSLIVYSESGITDGALQAFGKPPGLETLQLHSSEVTDASMKQIASITTLEFLLIDSPSITPRGVRYLAALPDLMTLELIGLTGDHDIGPILLPLKSVDSIGLKRCTLPSITLAGDPQNHVGAALTTIVVEDCDVTSIQLTNLTNLQTATLDGPKIKRILIEDLPGLQQLDVSLAAGQKLEQLLLKDLPRLHYIGIQSGSGDAEVPAETFANLLELKNLQGGFIWGLKLSDEAKAQIQRLSVERGVQL